MPMNYTRRDFGRVALAAIPMASALANINSKFGGVQIGSITYSFRETNDLDTIIKMMTQIGLGEAELMSNHAETAAGAPIPPRTGQGRAQASTATTPGATTTTAAAAARQAPRRGPRPPMTEEQIAAARARNEELRKWRLAVSMDKFREVRQRFDTAGIDVRLLCFNMNE